MKINPSFSKTSLLYPTLMAIVGAVLTGCDKQTAPGVVPYKTPDTTEPPAEADSNQALADINEGPRN